MTEATTRSNTIAEIIHSDVKTLFDLMYGTPQRSRVTVFVSLAVYAFYMIGASLQQLSQVRGVCSF